MSTAGKVLVVLVALVMVGWIILFSMVGQLNSNWGEKVQAWAQEKTKLEAKQEQEAARLDRVLNEIDAIQVDRIQKTRVLRTALEDREGLLARDRETLAAAQVRLEKLNASVQAAQAGRDRRIQEKAETEKELAARRTELEGLRAQNADLLARLTRLRGDFKRTLDENKGLLRRVAEAGPRVRPASFVH
jgi:chromosome segregation ATPase